MGLRESLDRANPNTLADQFRLIKLGQTLRQDLKVSLRGLDADAAGSAAEDLAALDSIVLPDDAKAGIIHRAYAKLGGAGTGEMTVAARHATPGTGEIGIAPSGNIVLLAADAITSVDIEYLPERGDVEVVVELDVATSVLTLPTPFSGNVMALLRADATVGGVTGRKNIFTQAAGLPAAGQARLDVAGLTVSFGAADAVTRAIVTLLVNAAADLNALLEDDSVELI